jgi:hypothetical protein
MYVVRFSKAIGKATAFFGINFSQQLYIAPTQSMAMH